MHGFDHAVDLLRRAERVGAMTGAGISTGSGIPDFRSPGGLWTKFDPSEFQFDRFLRDPARFWRLRAELMDALDLDSRRPNAAHQALKRLEDSGKLRGLVTQNIDGLHSLAGHAPERIIEIHGSARKVRCIRCLRFFPFEAAREDLKRGLVPPPCPDCAGILKPGTVLFGEMLPEDELRRAGELARSVDVFLTVGSSLEVWPASGIPRAAQDAGAALVIVNRDATALDADADAVVRGELGDVLPRLVSEALA